MRSLHRRRLAGAVVLAAMVGVPASLLANADPAGRFPPPTPVPPNGHLSPFPHVLSTPADPVPAPSIGARGALLADLDSGQILFAKDAEVPRPIASLTKLMTALVVLRRTGPGDLVRVASEAVFHPHDYGATSILGLRAGESIRVRDLLEGLVLGSANDAAEALAIHVSGDTHAFVAAMNARAAALGMRHTLFASPHGLDDGGVSTPEDLLILARAAEAEPLLRGLAAKRFVSIPQRHGPDRRIQNRNALLWLYPGATGMKTGFTFRAGACLIATAERDGRRLVAVVLGSEDEAFSDAAALLQHGFEGFEQRSLVREGEDLGTVRVRGGRIPVVAAGSLEGLVPVSGADPLRSVIQVRGGVAFPPRPGEPVGRVRFASGDLPIGSVPVLAGIAPAPAPIDGRWWLRSLGSLVRAAHDVVRGVAT